MFRCSVIVNVGIGNEFVIVEVQFDCVVVYVCIGVFCLVVWIVFGEVVDVLIDLCGILFGSVFGMQDYFDLLVVEFVKLLFDIYDWFFWVVQVNGELVVVCQFSQLWMMVIVDVIIVVGLCECVDLECEIIWLCYVLVGGMVGEVVLIDLVWVCIVVEQWLLVVDVQFVVDFWYCMFDDMFVMLVELCVVLCLGEVFFKLMWFDYCIYGFVVIFDWMFVYYVVDSEVVICVVEMLGKQLCVLIDGGFDVGKFVFFDEVCVYMLFWLVVGLVVVMFQVLCLIVVDLVGLFEMLLIGVFVMWYDVNVMCLDLFDFLQMVFFVCIVLIFNVFLLWLFLVVCSILVLCVQWVFIGFGQYSVFVSVSGVVVFCLIVVGYGCNVNYGCFVMLLCMLKLISVCEFGIVVGVLQVCDVQLLIGVVFSDISVEVCGDFDQYEVVYFVIYGLIEGMWGCFKLLLVLVMLFGDVKFDGLFSFLEIVQFWFDVNFVVLFVCDIVVGVCDEGFVCSFGQEEVGVMFEGLVCVFFIVNVCVVFVIYWQVLVEQESDEFICVFYVCVWIGMMGEVMQDVQCVLIVQLVYLYLFYWVFYFLVGDSSKMVLIFVLLFVL